MNSAALVEKLEVWGFEDGITVFKDASMGFGFRIAPVDISCQADEQINQIRAQLRGFLASLPAETDIQFVQRIEKTGGSDLETHLDQVENSPGLIRDLARRRIHRFSQLDEVGALPLQENLVLVRIPFRNETARKVSLFRFDFGDVKEETELSLNHTLARCGQLRDDVERNLIAAGFKVDRLEPSETIERIFDDWNPAHPACLTSFDETDIRDRVLLSEMVKDIKGFRLGSTHHRVITLKMLPEEPYAGMASQLANLPFSSRLFLSITVPDQSKEIEWLKLNRRMAYSMVIGKKGVSDLESEAKLKDIEETLNELVKDGERIYFASLSIVLRSESEFELESQVSHVLQIIRDLSGAEGFVETYAASDVFTETSVPNARGKTRSSRLKGANLADLLPVFGLWRGFDRPSVLLRTKIGSLFKFDPFCSTLSNANQIISGGSGSGKSYLTNLMMGQMLAQNPRVFILDVGGSYQKTCELLDGQYIPLSLTGGISLNPFDTSIAGKVPDEKIKFLVALIQIMTKEDNEQSIGKLEKSEVERLIQEVYVDSSTPQLSTLRDRLLTSTSPEVQRIGKILSLWSGNSPFGKFFDRPTNIELKKRIVCFDLKGLESNQDLQAAALFTITDMVWREVQKDRSEMKFLVFDECWRLLESDAGSQFVGEVYRTFRKYFASAIAISQNIDDFAKSKAASAILPNAAIKWILKQPGADFKRLTDVLHLNHRETSLIQNLSQVKGKYSEAFLMCEDRRAVVSIESTPFEYWLATTDPKDFVLMKTEKEKSGLDGARLIEHLATRFPLGASSIPSTEKEGS